MRQIGTIAFFLMVALMGASAIEGVIGRTHYLRFMTYSTEGTWHNCRPSADAKIPMAVKIRCDEGEITVVYAK